MRTDVHENAIFRCGARLYAVVGIFATVLFTLGVLIGFKKGDWSFLVLASGGTAAVFSLLAYLRLEIWESGLTYRNLSGTRSVEFAEIEKAWFERVTGDGISVAAFWVGLRNGKRMKINLRTFSVRAAAVLFTALERCVIPIEVPDGWAAQRMVRQIRAEQSKLRG